MAPHDTTRSLCHENELYAMILIIILIAFSVLWRGGAMQREREPAFDQD